MICYFSSSVKFGSVGSNYPTYAVTAPSSSNVTIDWIGSAVAGATAACEGVVTAMIDSRSVAPVAITVFIFFSLFVVFVCILSIARFVGCVYYFHLISAIKNSL